MLLISPTRVHCADISYFRRDIVMLHLTVAVPLSDHVSLACLPQAGDVKLIARQRMQCTVIGWGHTGKGKTAPSLHMIDPM